MSKVISLRAAAATATLGAPKAPTLRYRRSLGATSSEHQLALPGSMDAESKHLTIKLEITRADSIREDLLSDPQIAMEKKIEDWQKAHSVPVPAMAALQDKGLCLEALSLAQVAEIKKILSDAEVRDPSVVSKVVTALSALDKTWLSTLKSDRDSIADVVLKKIPATESELARSFLAVSKDIGTMFSEAFVQLETRKRQLLVDLDAGKNEKMEALRAEKKRFSAQLRNLDNAIDEECFIVGDVSIACADKRDHIRGIHQKATLGPDNLPFGRELLVNGMLLFKAGDLGLAIDSLGKVDNCMVANIPEMESIELFTHNSMRFVWTQTDDAHDSEIAGFEVQYSRSVYLLDDKPETDALVKWTTLKVDKASAVDVEDASKFSLVVDGLKHGVTYFVRIRAVNMYGTSQPSFPLSVHMADISGPPKPTLTVELVGKVNAKLKWEVPPPDVDEIVRSSTLLHSMSSKIGPRLDELSHFHLQYKKGSKKSWKSVVVSALDGTQHTVEHMSPGRVYTFRVRARNKVDWSLWSEALHLEVPSAGPEEMSCKVVEYRAAFSKAFSPSNLLKHSDMPYASSGPDDFDSDEADWVVFGTLAPYNSLTRVMIEQYSEASDVRNMAIEVCADIFKEDWIILQPSVIKVRKIDDRQIFDLRPLRSQFRYVRVSFLDNHQSHDDHRDDVSKKFVVRQLKLFGVPA